MNKFIFLSRFYGGFFEFGGVRLFANQKTCDVSAAQKGCENLDLVCIGIGLDGCELDETKSLRVVLKTCDGYVRVCVNSGVAYRKGRAQKRRAKGCLAP